MENVPVGQVLPGALDHAVPSAVKLSQVGVKKVMLLFAVALLPAARVTREKVHVPLFVGSTVSCTSLKAFAPLVSPQAQLMVSRDGRMLQTAHEKDKEWRQHAAAAGVW